MVGHTVGCPSGSVVALGEKGGVGLGEDSLGRWREATLKHRSAPLLGSCFFLESYHGSGEHQGSGEHHKVLVTMVLVSIAGRFC